MSELTVIGVDLATSTGWCVISKEKGLIAYGKVVLSASKPPHRERFKSWEKEFKVICKKYKPDEIFIEELHRSRNMNTTKILCGLLAVTVLSAPARVKISMCHQGTAKKDIVKPAVGRAKLSKEDVFQWAVETYSLEGLNFKEHNDITDAILVATWGLHSIDVAP